MPPQTIECRSYTHARRHPLVIGKIGGWTIPSPLTPAQLMALIATFLLLLYTRRLWAHFPGTVNLMVQGGVPIVMAWAVRHLRVEGRSPLRSLLGLGILLSAPRHGVFRGRPFHPGRTRRVRRTRVRFADAGPGVILPGE